MRYWIGFVVGLVAAPLGVSAQAEQAASPGASALELQLDSEGVQVSPLAASVAVAREHAEMERGVQAARTGVGVSVVPLVLGGIICGAAMASWSNQEFGSDTSSVDGALYLGVAFIGVGVVSMIATGTLLGVRKRRLREYEQEHRLGAHRIQRNIARSRLVF